MSLSTLYTNLRAELETIPALKYVRLFRNQFQHEQKEIAFLYPCCLIEIKNIQFRDLLKGVQQYDLIITLHLGFESYKDEDLDVLTLKQDVYKKVQRFQTAYFALLSRQEERPNWDHDNIQVYEIDYRTTGKDFDKDTRPATPATVATLEVTGDLVIDNNNIRTAGVIP